RGERQRRRRDLLLPAPHPWPREIGVGQRQQVVQRRAQTHGHLVERWRRHRGQEARGDRPPPERQRRDRLGGVRRGVAPHFARQLQHALDRAASQRPPHAQRPPPYQRQQ